MIGDTVTTKHVRVGIMLPPIYERLLTDDEFTFVVETALSEGEANAKLRALLDAALELKVASLELKAAG